jgi:hypothetical protein
MWQCVNCGEQHEEPFDTCWNCGTLQSGEPAGDFVVSEPVDAASQAPEEPDALPSLELPTFTYYVLPLFLWIGAVWPLFQDPLQEPHFISDIHDLATAWPMIVFEVALMIVVGIPIGVRMFRWFYRSLQEIGGSKPRIGATAGAVWFLSMFRLPQSIGERHRWFAPIYYGSFAAPIVQMTIVIVRVARTMP